jgi:hypothetical protein
MWGFERIRNGATKRSYTHPLFHRGQPELCRHMKCHKIKNTAKVKTKKTRPESTKLPQISRMVTPPTARSIIIDENIPMDSELFSLADDDFDLFEGRTFHVVQDWDDRVLSIEDLATIHDEIDLFEGGTFHFVQDYDDHALSIEDLTTNQLNFSF